MKCVPNIYSIITITQRVFLSHTQTCKVLLKQILYTRGSESKPINKFGGMHDGYSDFGKFFGLFQMLLK